MDLRNMRQLLIKLIYLIILIAPASCGQKGDLYLPDKNQAALPKQSVNS
jgi:predicted small lipoprotein YifL